MNNTLFNNLKIVNAETSMLWSLCPFHKDTTRANLSISLHPKYLGRYKCWACGEEGWLTLEQQKVLQLESKNICKKQYAPINWFKAAESCYNHYFDLSGYDPLAEDWDIASKVLSILRAGWSFDYEAYTFPFRNENNEITGIQLRYPSGKKRCIEGSKLGIFIPQGIDWTKQQIIFITEGVSDLATLLDMGFVGVGRASANSCEGVVIKWLENNTKKGTT